MLSPTSLKRALLLFVGFFVASPLLYAADSLEPLALKCEYAVDPMGIDASAPRLFWQVASDVRGQKQTAYQVVVATTLDAAKIGTGDLWHSGKVASSETTQIPYAGKPLASARRVYWSVRVWDKDGAASAWSPPATWTMGLLSEKDWTAHWIAAAAPSPSLLLRREFGVKPKLVRAVAFVCGLGQYEMTINGVKAGDDLLSPGWSKYDKTCLYETRDLTPLLKEGGNAIGIELGNGMYNVVGGRYTKFKGTFGPLKAIAQIQLEYADGTSETIGTDATWKTSAGPIAFSEEFGGEDLDARAIQKGWDAPGFDDSHWTAAAACDGPGGTLRGLSASAPPIRAIETLQPKAIDKLTTATWVVDLGQNASIIPRLRVKGDAGSIVKITPAELLAANGRVNRGSAGGGQAYWQYTLAGGGAEETWFPKFFYQGARYLQIDLTPARAGGALPDMTGIEGVVVQSSSPAAGEFSCSNELFNRIHALVRWAQRSNMVSVLTDCPHREKLGWLEQYHLNGPSLRYEFDLARLFSKGMNDMADSQTADGLIPDIAPEYTVFPDGFRDSPEWGSAFVLVPWQQYEWDGDLQLLKTHYAAMKRYVAYLQGKSKDNILDYGLGDWYDIGPARPGKAQLTSVELTATAFYYQDARILAQAAALLDNTADAQQYEELSGEIAQAFNQKFYRAEAHQYATGSQTANAIPLVMGLAPEADRAAIVENIVKDVRARGDAISAGDVGYRYLLRALADGGRSDVIYAMNNQSTKPGYGYQLAHGATSLTEAWNADPRSSQNHFMLGQINEWFYHDLAGIAPDPARPGFQSAIIRPRPVGDLASAQAGYDSLRGRFAVAWKKSGGALTLDVEIPANATATVFVPAADDAVEESGVEAAKSPGVKFLEREDGAMVYAVESGKYEFKSRL